MKGISFFCVGGARGFDTLAAQAVLKTRESNSSVKLIMILPCREQDLLWNDTEKCEYRRLLNAADKIICVSNEPYFDGCMAARNLYLVQQSCTCVAYMKHGRSGTSQTVRIAREYGLTVINLANMN